MPTEEKEEIREFDLQPGYVVRVADAYTTRLVPGGVCRYFTIDSPTRLVLEPQHTVSKARLLLQRDKARRDLAALAAGSSRRHWHDLKQTEAKVLEQAQRIGELEISAEAAVAREKVLRIALEQEQDSKERLLKQRNNAVFERNAATAAEQSLRNELGEVRLERDRALNSMTDYCREVETEATLKETERAKVAILRRDLDAAQCTIADLRNRVDREPAAKRIEELEADRDNLRKCIEDWQAEYGAAQKAHSKQYRALRDERNAAQQALEHSEAELDRMRYSCEHYDAVERERDIAQQARKLAETELESERDRFVRTLAAEETKLAATQRTLECVREEHIATQRELDAEHEKRLATQRALDAVREERNRLQEFGREVTTIRIDATGNEFLGIGGSK